MSFVKFDLLDLFWNVYLLDSLNLAQVYVVSHFGRFNDNWCGGVYIASHMS